MTAAAVGAPPRARETPGRLATWCGWVMVGAAVLTPLVAWLSPLGFAPLLAVMGLLCLPALRLADEDRPLAIVLLGALVWAAASTTWSPFRAGLGYHSVILEIALGLPLFWSAVCGARRADPRLNELALTVLAWGLALFGLMLAVEAFTGAALYRRLHEAYYQPIRVDLAQVNLGHSTYVVAALAPAVLVGRAGGPRRLARLALLLTTVVGMVLAAHAFGADAPVLAVPLAALAMLAVWFWPRVGPRLFAGVVAVTAFLMPALIWGVRASGQYGRLEQLAPASWAVRMHYWSHTLDWIHDQPVRGWGLDASRVMGPGIQLHPHNGALQVWLELGLVGAVAAAVFWGLSLMRLSRAKPDLGMTGVAGSAAAYVLFAWVNFGLWQQWWLAVGAFIPVLAAMLDNREDIPKST